MLALDRERDWRPPIVLTEAMRGEGVPSCGRRSRRTARISSSRGSSTSAAGATSPPRCSRSRPSRASSHLERAVADDPELRRLLDEVQARRARPADRRSGDTREGVPHSMATTRQHPRLPEIEQARERLDGRRARHAGLPLRDALAARRPRGVAQGGEPAAHRLVQDPRRVQPDLDADAGAARGGRRRRERRQPRPGGRLGGARGRRPRAHLHAAGRADGEGRRDAQLRRRDRAGRAGVRGGARGGARVRRGDRRDVRPRVRGRGDHRGPGDDRARARRAAARRSRRSSSRSAAAGSRPGSRSRCARCGRGVRIVGVQAAGTLPGGPGYTIADGIAVKQPGELTMSILDRVARRDRRRRRRGDQRGDRAAARALEARRRGRRRRRRRGAAHRQGRRQRHGRVALLSGGNIDATLLISVMRHGLARRRPLPRPAHARRRPSGRAGEAADAARGRAREHRRGRAPARDGRTCPVGDTGVELTLVTRDPAHCDEILSLLAQWGYAATRLA